MKNSAPVRLAFLLATISLFCSFSTKAQDLGSGEVIKVDTRLVSVPVIVSDRNGRYIPNLKAADFSVFQDGVKQEVEFFAATEEPLTVALLIDTSQSTRSVLDDIEDSAVSFVKLLGPKDRAMIVSFDYDTHILSGITSDKQQLERAIYSAEIPEDFGTTLRDAVYETVNRSFAGITGRKAIILMTDGKDARSRVSSGDLLYTLQETDTLIYTIMFKTNERQALRQVMGGERRRNGGIFGGGGMGGRFPGGGNGRRRSERIEQNNRNAAEFLQTLSTTTAGRFYESEDGKLKRTFASIVDELRFQYRLGYYPADETSTEKVHQIKVKIGRDGVVVRARSSYRSTEVSK